MLTEQRYEKILRLLEEKKTVTVTELTEFLGASESTVRRDITALDKAGRLTRVFGGAVVNQLNGAYEPTVAQKEELFREEKGRIAAYAAGLIEPEDFIFLDAGTTTGRMLDFLPSCRATFVTNAVAHAQKLASRGCSVFLLGGALKDSTEAVVGSQALLMLQSFHFTKGFFGTNGVTKKAGFTTPDIQEAQIKKAAMTQCGRAYVLCDHSKFGVVSSVTFGALKDGILLSDEKAEGYDVTLCGKGKEQER